jgi:hypothetical protein
MTTVLLSSGKKRIKNQKISVMTKFFFYSFIAGIVSSIIVGLVGVAINADEISIRNEITEMVPRHMELRDEFFNLMEEKNISTDSLLYFYQEVCDCNRDSIVLVKLMNSSNVNLDKNEFNAAYKTMTALRKSEDKLSAKWVQHVSNVEVVKNWVDEDRGVIPMENILVGIKDEEMN